MILAVNVLWAAAFYGYVRRSTTPVLHGGELLVSKADKTNTAATTTPGTTNLAAASTNKTPAVTAATTPANQQGWISVGREFSWKDVTNDVYTNYITRLRAAGCPSKQVESIVVSDVNESFDHRRLEQAIRVDTPWWKSDNYFGMLQIQMQGGPAPNLDEERNQLLTKLLGEDWSSRIKVAPLTPAGAVPLAGPVLGALPSDTYNNVQEVCSRSMERHNNYISTHMNEGLNMESAEMAKLRDFTRTELTKILTPEQLEEFLLRYSHNSSKLRNEMRGMDLTPEEFRKVFRALDPMEHQMQLDYGGPAGMSQKQKEQFEAQRDRAIREALTPQRYQQYLATKDPHYQRAQLLAGQYGLSARAIQPIFEMEKSLDARRMQVSTNATLTAEQKAQALQGMAVEQQQALQKMMMDGTYRR